MPVDYQRYIDRADNWITERTRIVILGFLVLTIVFGAGLTNVETQAGTEQFAEEVPAEQALQRINEEFEPAFAPNEGSTQLIQSAENVLAKKELLRMLRAQHRLSETPGLRVTATASAASIIARTIDPTAESTDDQIDAIEHATPREIRRAVRTAAATNPQFVGLLSTDFNRQAAAATATVAVVTHETPADLGEGAGQGGDSPLTPIQLRAQSVVNSVGGDIRVFGAGIFAAEFSNIIADTMIIVIPAALILIVVFLIVAYRDLVDLIIAVIALFMTLIWTFGLLGLIGLPFNQLLIAVPPLLLAVGIDFGIHAVNRYREERVRGYDIDESIARMTDQIVVAFFIVAATTVIGFLSNLSSALVPIRDFGIVASIGIIFTFAIFGVFLPAVKVWVDRLRQQYPIPTFSNSPLGSEESLLGRSLTGGVEIAKVAPAVFVALVLLATVGGGYYATGLDTSFSQRDFLPPADIPDYLEELPEPFAPSEYTIVATLDFLEANFETSQDDAVTIYIQGHLQSDHALEAIDRNARHPPQTFTASNRRADATSIVTIIRAQTAADPEFRAVVRRNDRDGNGIPDKNLGEVYDALLDSPARAQALNYLHEDRRSTRVVYSVKADADQSEVTADAQEVADRSRFHATATGSIVVFQAISDLILESAVVSLIIALTAAVIFLVLAYWALEGTPLLGIANTVPIFVTVAAIGATMRFAGISFNAFTATILAITIGLGIDYSVHVTHRFIDEYWKRGDPIEALNLTVVGTGGALTGSMLTTVFGIGVLVLAIFPAIQQFGLLTGLSVFYSFVASIVILPSVLVLWAQWSPKS